jgi:mono/diheme cytochrome c family protein
MTRDRRTTLLLVLTLTALSGAIVRALAPAPKSPISDAAEVERGAYLVRAMGCNDCHTPWKMGPRGPEPDMTRALTGHPADVVMPPPPSLPPGPWTWMGAVTNTAFAGPWGVSFTANLTPDPETGLGKWTADMFIAALRTGRHEGKGRPILPPMPAQMIAKLNDDDLKAIFAYLQSLAPVSNRVPQPIDPPEGQQ